MNGFPYIFAFYSFKGGVGRSMALLNVAYALAGRGRHVLMLDMDLEAPGLSGFLQRDQELPPLAKHDIVDLLSWARTAAEGLSPDQPQFDPAQFPAAADYVVSIKPENLQGLKPRLGELGRLDVIPADDAREYYDRFTSLQLGGLQQDQIVGMGRVLRAWLKSLTVPVDVPDYYGPEAPRSVPYDYVLIDSRTGISEIGGLCIGPLADRLVVLTALNDQNIEGTKRFLGEVGINKVREKDDPPWDEADVAPGTELAPPRLGPKPTLLVASPVPAGELTEKKLRLAELADKIGPVAGKISYHPQLALHETIFVRDWPDEYLAREYFALSDQVMATVNDHGGQLKIGFPDLQEGRQNALERALRAASHRPDQARYFLMMATQAASSSDAAFWVKDRAFQMLATADHFGRSTALFNWGNTLVAQARKTETEADRLFALAGEKYEAALRIEPDMYEALFNWGNAISEQAMQKEGAEADRLFVLAGEKYEAAVRIKPDQHEALYNWGVALSEQAQQKQGAEADRLFALAEEKLIQAENLAPGVGAYNLACLCALRGRDQECRTWLEKWKAHGKRPSKQHLLDDTDLVSLRGQAWFQYFLADT